MRSIISLKYYTDWKVPAVAYLTRYKIRCWIKSNLHYTGVLRRSVDYNEWWEQFSRLSAWEYWPADLDRVIEWPCWRLLPILRSEVNCVLKKVYLGYKQLRLTIRKNSRTASLSRTFSDLIKQCTFSVVWIMVRKNAGLVANATIAMWLIQACALQ